VAAVCYRCAGIVAGSCHVLAGQSEFDTKLACGQSIFGYYSKVLYQAFMGGTRTP
jgi:hypothetical protein